MRVFAEPYLKNTVPNGEERGCLPIEIAQPNQIESFTSTRSFYIKSVWNRSSIRKGQRHKENVTKRRGGFLKVLELKACNFLPINGIHVLIFLQAGWSLSIWARLTGLKH
jgi:hypothetical protein